MIRVNDSFCELKSVFLTTKSVGIGQLTRITESPIPDSKAALHPSYVLSRLRRVRLASTKLCRRGAPRRVGLHRRLLRHRVRQRLQARDHAGLGGQELPEDRRRP